MSIGLASRNLGETRLRDLMGRAEAVLYQAKRGGRNLVVSASLTRGRYIKTPFGSL
jgi:PleD family two-component response regulator